MRGSEGPLGVNGKDIHAKELAEGQQSAAGGSRLCCLWESYSALHNAGGGTVCHC